MHGQQHKPALQKKASAPSAANPSRAPVADPAHVPAWAGALPIQAKLTINQPGDIYEQEADEVAERVMRMPELSVQRKCACGGDAGPDGECEACKARRLGLQRKADGIAAGEAPASVHETLGRSGQPLEAGTRTFMESRFGADFGGVRVHTDAYAARAANDINASAFTYGQDIYFGEGKFKPAIEESDKLLAHELTHTIQQRENGAVQAKPNERAAISQLGDTLEHGVEGGTQTILAGDQILLKEAQAMGGETRSLEKIPGKTQEASASSLMPTSGSSGTRVALSR